MITIEREEFTPEMYSELGVLTSRHNDESYSSLGNLYPNLDLYFTLSALEFLDTFVARKDGEMIGYLITITQPHIHHQDKMVASEDIFFVDKNHRNGRVGIQLVKFAESYVKDKGAEYFLVSYSENKDLTKFYTRLGFSPMERTFYKKLEE